MNVEHDSNEYISIGDVIEAQTKEICLTRKAIDDMDEVLPPLRKTSSKELVALYERHRDTLIKELWQLLRDQKEQVELLKAVSCLDWEFPAHASPNTISYLVEGIIYDSGGH